MWRKTMKWKRAGLVLYLKKTGCKEHERKMWDSKLRTSRGHVTPSRHPFSCREKITCPGKITDIGHVQGHVQDMSRTCETKEMAIADLILSDNLPDRVVESPRFQLVFQYACFVDSTFKIPSCKEIGGNVLTLTTRAAWRWTNYKF